MTAIATRALNHLSILGPRTPGSLSDCRQGICSVRPFPAGLKGTFPSLSLIPGSLLEVKKKIGEFWDNSWNIFTCPFTYSFFHWFIHSISSPGCWLLGDMKKGAETMGRWDWSKLCVKGASFLAGTPQQSMEATFKIAAPTSHNPLPLGAFWGEKTPLSLNDFHSHGPLL